MNMIEKVARAIKWRKLGDRLEGHFTKETMFIHGCDLEDARVAIEAMREPTEEMKQAAARGVSDSFHEEGFQEGDDPSLWNEFVKAGERAWKNALATALKEQP